MDRYRNLNRADLVRLVSEAEARLAAPAGDDAQQLVHDLQLHQIELEIQNQDLRADAIPGRPPAESASLMKNISAINDKAKAMAEAAGH